MESTWETRDLPVLTAIVRHFDETDTAELPTVRYFAEQTGLDVRLVARAIRALSPTFISTSPTMGGIEDVSVEDITDAARQAVGQWPSPDSVTDRIVRELLAAAEREPDDAKRTRLRAAAETVGGFARDVVVSVIANVATKPIGF